MFAVYSNRFFRNTRMSRYKIDSMYTIKDSVSIFRYLAHGRRLNLDFHLKHALQTEAYLVVSDPDFDRVVRDGLTALGGCVLLYSTMSMAAKKFKGTATGVMLVVRLNLSKLRDVGRPLATDAASSLCDTLLSWTLEHEGRVYAVFRDDLCVVHTALFYSAVDDVLAGSNSLSFAGEFVVQPRVDNGYKFDLDAIEQAEADALFEELLRAD